MYTNASNNTPTYIHIGLYMVGRVHPGSKTLEILVVHNTLEDVQPEYCFVG